MTAMMTDQPIEPDIDKPMHTVDTVAKMFGVKPSTVRGWITQKKVKGVKVLNRWHIPHDEVVRIANEEYGND